MKVFYARVFIPHEIRELPLIFSCYPKYILLRAKTKEAAIAEAKRIQKKQDDIARRLINKLNSAGCNYKGALEFAPRYADCIYCFDTDNGDRAKRID